MDYKNDFVNEEVVEFQVDERVFGYKPTTAGDENDWLNEYMVPNEDGTRLVQDSSKLNKCKLKNLVTVPWPKELIQQLIGLSKDWCNLNYGERWEVLSKLNPSLFSEIIKKINQIDNPLKKKD